MESYHNQTTRIQKMNWAKGDELFDELGG